MLTIMSNYRFCVLPNKWIAEDGGAGKKPSTHLDIKMAFQP